MVRCNGTRNCQERKKSERAMTNGKYGSDIPVEGVESAGDPSDCAPGEWWANGVGYGERDVRGAPPRRWAAISMSVLWMTFCVCRMSATCASRLRIRLERQSEHCQKEKGRPELTLGRLHRSNWPPLSASRINTRGPHGGTSCMGGSRRPRSASSACGRHSVEARDEDG